LLKQVRSRRGTLASKARDALFAVFGEANLPSINTNASSTEISRWKKKPEISNCYKRLFERIDDNKEDSPWVLTQIAKRVLNNKSSRVEMAFVVAICVSILNPKDSKLTLTTKKMKSKVKYYLVSFCT
jgi:hypothetical protein